MINKFFTEVLDLYAPRTMKVKQEGTHELKLSKECQSLMKDRDKLKKQAKKTGNNSDWDSWRRLKNMVNNIVRNEHVNQLKTEFLECEKDLSGQKMWIMVKSKAGWLKTLSLA